MRKTAFYEKGRSFSCKRLQRLFMLRISASMTRMLVFCAKDISFCKIWQLLRYGCQFSMLRIAVFYKMIRSQLFVKRMAVFNDEDGIFLIQYNECSFLWLGWHLSFGKCRWLAWSPVLSSDCNQPIQYFIIFTLHICILGILYYEIHSSWFLKLCWKYRDHMYH